MHSWFIDTAEAYGPFDNEKLIGRALGSRRDEITIATKASSETDDDGTVHGRNGTPEYIRRACERSLRHLGMDVIDLYYLHLVDPNVPIEESVGALADLVREGKVRHIGLSEASAPTLRRAHAVHPIAAVQSEFSLFARDMLHNDEKATADELGIGVVAFSPSPATCLRYGEEATAAESDPLLSLRCPRRLRSAGASCFGMSEAVGT